MAFATGSAVQVTTLKESVYGTPAFASAGDTQVIPFISNNLNLNKAIFEDPSIQSNRQSKFHRHGNVSVDGDVSFAYSHEAFDGFLESVFFDTFNANVLKIGSTLQSYTVEVGHTDIDQYRLFTGIVANSMSLEVNLDGVVSSTFGLMGQDMAVSGVAQDSAPTAAVSKAPMVHLDGSVKEGGVTSAIITSISLNIDNGLSQNYALGDGNLKSLTSAMAEVTGSMTLYFEDTTILNKFINETATSIEFVLNDDSGNSHTFLLPNVSYDSSSLDISDGATLPISIEFKALYDVTEGTIVKVTRTA